VKLMKTLVAIIQPVKLEMVKEALTSIGVRGITLREVKGFGRQQGKREVFRGTEYVVEFLPKVKLEIVLEDELVDKAIDVIRSAVRTGQIGDGKIFILLVEEALRIRTGERGKEAI